MQTGQIFSLLQNSLGRRILASATAIVTMLSLAACDSPRLESQAEQAGPCRSAYSNAMRSTSRTMAGNPFAARYLSAGDAAQAWKEAAASCPAQFGIYTMKSVQMQWIQTNLAPLTGVSSTVHPNAENANLNEVVALSLDNKTIGDVALAEDRAGFETEVLAAKGVNGATLRLSDDHKAVAARLISIEPHEGMSNTRVEDPRQKVYDTNNLLAHPDVITDPSTDLQAPTIAVVEMDCARESLTALASALTVSGDDDGTKHRDNVTGGATGTSLAVLSDLISSRAYLALSEGYPATDAALLG
jgi:hypothetical protein